MQLAGQKVLVMGMGRSGVAAAEYAIAMGASVIVTDSRTDAPAINGATHHYGGHQRDDFIDADLVIVSPGIPATAPDIKAAQTAGVTVISELGFAAKIIQERDIPIIAVTGTNGKSSVVYFMSQLLVTAGYSVFIGGNIGVALTELAASNARPDFAVVEVSSYQLELPGSLAPISAAVLNLGPDHLDRHGSMGVYANTKTALFSNMAPGSFSAIPGEDKANPNAILSHGNTLAKALWLDQHPGMTREGDVVRFKGTPDDGDIRLTGLGLLGEHNRDNAAAAAFLLVCAGVPRAAIRPEVLTPLPHRLEPVHTHRGVDWINDSKATNIDAAIVGISAIQSPLILLLGGQGKAGSDYRRLNAPIAKTTHTVICFGAAGPEISHSIQAPQVLCVPTLVAAVKHAATVAKNGDVVLMSPAAASFDEFENFENRGEAFTRFAQEHSP